MAGADLIDITAVNLDIFSLNHDIYANRPAIIVDLKRLLKEGQRPPEVRTSELEKVPVGDGVCWRYRAPGEASGRLGFALRSWVNSACAPGRSAALAQRAGVFLHRT